MSAHPLTLKAAVYRQTAKERCRDEGVSRKLSLEVGRKVADEHRRRREGVVADDDPIAAGQNERRGHPSTGILAGLALEIAIQRRGPAGKFTADMARLERLDSKVPLGRG